ncbi:Uncharacterised protein [Legionella pneumophila]|nr:hypothetical protein [Legionella pneumophila subsp. pneumophila]CZG69327.1 Uncharacterised protein [Legionella pneumophila]CZH15594.1 Uncharacterised protein [Legionella pneumophila]CZH32277.1 Uncharacterised protein [Legionella pneumophila]CZH47290.1 Uncharacterised protein [Legionella pneumophila]
MAVREFNQYHFSSWSKKLTKVYWIKMPDCLLRLPATLSGIDLLGPYNQSQSQTKQKNIPDNWDIQAETHDLYDFNSGQIS